MEEVEELPSIPQVNMRALHSNLECSLCLGLICEPISIGCGHTFCRVCLARSLRRHKKLCPTCRQVCHVAAETAPENIIIKSIAMLLDPLGYSARLVENEMEKANWSAVYPIFYYNATIFPGNKLNLMLFEPRYKLMMQRIVHTTRSFAYVPNFVSYCASVGDVALVVQLRDVEFLADGRSYVDAVITGRHSVVDHYIEEGTQNLHYCRLEALRDDPIEPQHQETFQQLMSRAHAFMDKLQMREVERRLGSPPQDAENFSLWLTSLAPLTERDKMALLRSSDTIQRLGVVLDGLDAMEERMRNSPVNRMASYISSWFSGIVGAANNDSNTNEDGREANVEDQDDLEDNEDSDSDSSRSLSTNSRNSADLDDEDDEIDHEVMPIPTVPPSTS